jgi:hypothetical protein
MLRFPREQRGVDAECLNDTLPKDYFCTDKGHCAWNVNVEEIGNYRPQVSIFRYRNNKID